MKYFNKILKIFANYIHIVINSIFNYNQKILIISQIQAKYPNCNTLQVLHH